MTKIKLSNLLSINERIREIDGEILEIRERITSPKNQIISDMPKGNGSTENAIDNALTKIERKEARKAILYNQIKSEWNEYEEVFKSCRIPRHYIELMKYRYYHALEWKHCAIMMKKRHPNELWNENKVYRMNRHFVSICTKNGYEIC